MAYMDEDILKKREEEKRKKYSTIESGIFLDGKILNFEKKELLDEITVYVPESMILMPKEYARVKYPSEFRPQVIFTTMDLSVNLGFTVFPEEIFSNDVKKIAEQTQGAIHRAYPDYLIYPCKDINNTGGCYFSFRSHAMDSDLYNMSLVMALGKKLIQGSFNCYYKDFKKWEKMVVMIWESVQEV